MNKITIITFKWKRLKKAGYKLKNPVEYSSNHVNILYKSIQRNTSLPFNFLCITDDDAYLLPEIKTIKLWDKCKNLGGCYNRLYIFSNDMQELVGNRFLCIDLDCVITGNINNLLLNNNDFMINSYENKNAKFQQIYNGALFIMNAGARSQVWSKFQFEKSALKMKKLKDDGVLIGSDQAWIQYVLGTNEKRFTKEDGIYDYSMLPDQKQLPNDAKIVFFHGNKDPQIEKNKIDWINSHWTM